MKSANPISAALAKKISSREKIINQKITIRDVYLLPKKFGFSIGEINKKGADDQILRLLKHIRLISHVANEYHAKYYCENNSIRNDCLNKITRLLLPEYFLYTKIPLSLDDFNFFIRELTNIVEKMYENVHLLLSSIAVATPESELLNVALYIMCGKEPEIQVIHKANPYIRELTYRGFNPFHPHPGRRNTAAAFMASQNGLTLASYSFFIVKTVGGAEYLQGIDICADYEKQRTFNALREMLHRKDHLDLSLLPHQTDHLLTSNWIKADPTLKISKQPIVQVDANLTLRSIQYDDQVDLTALNDPPFGSPCVFALMPERALDSYTPLFQESVFEKNKKIKNAIFKQFLTQNSFWAINTPHTLNQASDLQCSNKLGSAKHKI